MIKNTVNSKRGNKSWLVVALKQQVIKAQNLASTLRERKPSNLFYLVGLYFVGTFLAYPLFFGFEMVEADSHLLAAYYLLCAMIPLSLMIVLILSLAVENRKSNREEKVFTVAMVMSFLINVVFAVLGFENLTVPVFERIDDIVIGYPVGLLDLVLAYCAVKSIK